VLASGHVKPEMLINIDSFAIIALMLPIAWLTGKFHPMIALIGGMLISLVGFFASGFSNVGFIVALAIFVFAIGEMWCSPKFSEYIGLTAPADKKALYMGYSNIPFAIGWAGGNLVSGYLYDHLGSKLNFARQYLVQQAGMSPADAAAVPQEKVMETMASVMNGGAGATVDDATRLLWNAHHPWIVWAILTAVGVVSTGFMIVYYFRTRKNTA
jgi:MFS family permease